MADDNVIELGARPNMTVDECLSLVHRQRHDYEDVMVVAIHKDDQRLVLRSSSMTRAFAAFLLQHALADALHGNSTDGPILPDARA